MAKKGKKKVTRTLVFQPQGETAQFAVKDFVKGRKHITYNFHYRRSFLDYESPVAVSLNKKLIIHQYSRMHYLACHAPVKVRKQYSKAYSVMHKRLFPEHASSNYANKYSAHSWL